MRRSNAYSRRPQRRGLSLLEVVVATVILAGALAVLGQLVENGRTAAGRSVRSLEAVSRCESILEAACVELSTGFAIADVPLEDGDWLSEVTVEQTDSEALVRVSVNTSHRNERGVRTANVTLHRLVYVVPEETL